MQCKELEFVLESEGLGPLPADARDHLAGCTACQDYLADLSSIVVAAKSLPAEANPPDRIWIALRAQLEAEGLIKEPTAQAEVASFFENIAAWFRPRSLATAAAGIVLVVTAVFLARNPQDNTVVPSARIQSAGNSATHAVPVQDPAPTVLAPSPTEDASITLDRAERALPSMQLAGNSQVDASLRQNLRTLNEFIAECEQHLKKNPQDMLAREYLYTAYQQKAELLAAMMESGRSEH